MKRTISSKQVAASDLSALIISGLYTVFYLSYVARHMVEGRANSLAELYDRSAAFNAALLTMIVSVMVFVYLARARTKIPVAIELSKKFDPRQAGLAALAVLALLAVNTSSPSISYEGLHQHIGESSIGKLLYVPYIYYSYLIARGIEKKPLYQQAILEFLIISLGFTLLVPMRSPILTHALVLVIIYRPPVLKFIFATLLIALTFITISISRGENNAIDRDQLIDAVGMLVFGPSLQIDLYEIAKADGYGTAKDLYEFLETRYEEYFNEGGGFGSFITLEVEKFIPGNDLAPIVIALAPLLLRSIGRRSRTANALVVIAGIQALTILRNPMASWLNGYIISLIFYEAFRKKA